MDLENLRFRLRRVWLQFRELPLSSLTYSKLTRKAESSLMFKSENTLRTSRNLEFQRNDWPTFPTMMITNYCSKVSSKFVVNCPFNSILFNVQNLKEIASKVARRRNLRTSNFLLSQRNLLKLQLLKKKNAATKRTWAKKVIQRIILAQPRRQIHRRLPRKLQQQRQPQQSNRK